MINQEHNCCIKLISMFCAQPNWAKEAKMAKTLLYKCPDLEAWAALKLPNKINSLSFFLLKENKIYIPLSQRNPYLLDLDKLRPKNEKKIDFIVEN